MTCRAARLRLACLLIFVAISQALVAGPAAAADAPHAEEEGFISIFNGKDLTRWSGDPAFWRVEDGAIVGMTTVEKPLAIGNTFAIWEGSAAVPRSLANFELRLRYRFDVDANNSGVQIRSRLMPEVTPWTIAGYQYDLSWNQRMTASMWGERSRGPLAAVGQKVVIDPAGRRWVTADVPEAQEIAANIRLRDWNDVAIRAVGNRIEFFHNGRKSLELIDHKDRGDDLTGRALEGLLALQLHKGPPMQVRFADIRVKLLPAGGVVTVADEPIGVGAKQIAPPTAESPQPVSPAAGAIVFSPHPHFRWQREADVRIDEVHRIQIARDDTFAEPICDDQLEVVSRFVPVNPVPPGRYWWRVRRGDGEWSRAVAFEVRAPEKLFSIRAGSDAETVARVLQEAGASGPARVDFEPGEYALSVRDRTGLATLENAHDLIIDGNGATLVLAGETCLLSLRDCQRVTVQNFDARSSQAGHTLVRVLSVDPLNARLVVKTEPGYDADVARFFQGEGNAGSYLNRVDPAHHGRHLSRGFVSARDAKAAPVPHADGQFYIGPVKATALSHHEPGALAVVTMYRSPFVRMDGTEECTLSNIRLVDHPGGPCLGNDNSAQSLLAVKAVCRTPADYQGGHSGVNNGRIGAWVEACEYECLADDGGPAHQALRMKVDRTDGPDAVILAESWTNSELRPADRIVFMDSLTGRFAITALRAVSGGRKAMRLQLGDDLATLATELGRESSQPWKGVLVYRYVPSNEDFVYRHNRHVGGRGHGVKFNGTRGWIADNHFENVTGNAIHVGFTYIEAISGVGARDVVVSGNTIIYSGWTPITCLSISRLGGNIVIRDNHITEAREAAIAIQGCDGVTLLKNTFNSTASPSRGAWIFAVDTKNVRTAENKHASEVPLMKTVGPSK